MNYGDITQLSSEDVELLKLKALLIQAFANMFSTDNKVEELDDMPQNDQKVIDKKHRLFNKIVHEISLYTAKESSRKERLEKALGSNSLTYGEIVIISFMNIYHI